MNKYIKNYVKKESVNLDKWIEERHRLYPIPHEIEFISNDEYSVYFMKESNQSVGVNNRPVIINFHGGGLLYGKKEQNDQLCVEMAKRGFLVFGVEYIKVLDSTIFDVFKDLTTKLNIIENELINYNVDKERVYWTGDSAGAYISIYLSAMKNDSNIAKAAGIDKINLNVRALGLFSPMIYTTKKDKIGLTLRKIIYGEAYKKSNFYPYINPENSNMLNALPKTYIATSKNDFLKHHGICFYDYLRKNRKGDRIRVFGKNKKLVHAFVALYPEYLESVEAIDEMIRFFSC